jgi:hypothetical protein
MRLHEIIFESKPPSHIEPILHELMKVLPSTLPSPEIKIMNHTNPSAYGTCAWRYGRTNEKDWYDKNTIIHLEKCILNDDKTLKRILAHELSHSADYLINNIAEIDKVGVKTFYARRKILRPDGHGSSWQAFADKFNAKYGKDFVTRKSDESYIADETITKPFFVVLSKFFNKHYFSFSLRLSEKQKLYIDRNYSPWKLYMITDRDFMMAPIGKGWADAEKRGLLPKWEALWNSGTEKLSGNLEEDGK